MKKQNNFVAKHNYNRASVHKDRSKEIPRDMKYEEDLLEYLKDLCEEPSYTVPQGLSGEERKEWAKMIASEYNTTYLSDDAWNKLQEVLDNPPEPNEAMKKLMEAYGKK